ncbi:MAG: PD40 domain-containing protein [Anaerolineae bacterium]|nr:PD40 domain-containing protein [Anaerolineae bacterium]
MTRRRRTPQDLMTTLLHSRETPVPLPGRAREAARPGEAGVAEAVPPEDGAPSAAPLLAGEGRGKAAPISVEELLLGTITSAPREVDQGEEPSDNSAQPDGLGQGDWFPPATPSLPDNGQDGRGESFAPLFSEGQSQETGFWTSGTANVPESNGPETSPPIVSGESQPASDNMAAVWLPGRDGQAESQDWPGVDTPTQQNEFSDASWAPATTNPLGFGLQSATGPAEAALSLPILGNETPAIPTAAQEPEYDEGLAHLQRGDWAAAQACFTALLARYPEDEALKSLIKETELRTTAEKQRPKARPWRKLSAVRRWGRRLIIAAGIIIAVLLVRQVYLQRIVPQQQQRVAEAKQDSLLDEARAALARGDFEAAERAFKAVLLERPEDTQAAAGLAEAQRQAALLADYRTATSLEAEGKTKEAMALYQSIRERAPVYRDVPQRISQLERVRQIEEAFAEAEAHFQAERWSEAVAAYERVRKLDGRYQRDLVEDRLFNSYLTLGKDLVNARPDSPQKVKDAVTAFNNALTLRPREEVATTERQFARSYLDALAPYEDKSWEEAIALLRPLYDQRPDYLGGLLVEQLYHAYLALGDQYRAKDDLLKAWETYRQAAGLGMDNTSEASRKAQEVAMVMTPTATPTPTTTPTVTPTNQPTATPTPEPTKQLPLARYRGRIAFWSDRDGGGALWIMNPDGTNAFRYNKPEEIEELRKVESYNPARTWFAFVKATGTGRETQIFYIRQDVPDTWKREFQVTSTGGIHYDPVWSPSGDRIAYVSNEVDGDEIWIIHPDGTDARRLTKNTWEWDKRPSWSPDGKQIVFWSNREGGRQQIYRMSADGTQQVNISRNKYNDWDPMWIK